MLNHIHNNHLHTQMMVGMKWVKNWGMHIVTYVWEVSDNIGYESETESNAAVMKFQTKGM